MGGRVSWIEHKGARILYGDYSGLSAEEIKKTISEFREELLKQAPGSVVTLTNTTNTTFTAEIAREFRALGEETRGISKGTAAIGFSGFQRAIGLLIRREIFYANSLEEAKDWLAEQAQK